MFARQEQLSQRGETSVVPSPNFLRAKNSHSPKSAALSAEKRERTNFLSEAGRPDDFALSAPRKNPRHNLLEGIKRQGKLQISIG